MANDAPTTDPVVDYGALLEEERASLSHQLAELGFGDAARERLRSMKVI